VHNLHGEMVEKALPACRPLQKVVHSTLNGQRKVILFATVHAGVEEKREVAIDGRRRVFSAALTALVAHLCRRRVAVGRGRALGGP